MIAEVIVDILNNEVDKVFDYIIPTALNVQVGQWVKVPFGKLKIDGFIIGLKETSSFDSAKLKPIDSIVMEDPVITSELLDVMHQMTAMYNLRKIDVLRLLIPSQLRTGKVKDKLTTIIQVLDESKLSEELKSVRKNAVKQKEFLEYMLACKECDQTKLNASFGSAVVKKYIQQGLVTERQERNYRSPFVLNGEDKRVQLNQTQVNAVHTILSSPGQTVLCHGVTGSGKTEVYMHAIYDVLEKGKNAIMLVPEISLTPQMLRNFKARFGDLVAILHSGLSAGERYDEWDKLRTGVARIAVGARSAIFAPLKNLGIIVIDEEHDGSYISESNPRYSAIEVAIMRARQSNCPLVLGSATPTIEDYYKAQNGEYKLVSMPVRANNKTMPPVTIVDMYSNLFKGDYGIISSTLYNALRNCMDQGKQALVFINRRGYTSFLKCTNCGYTPKCIDCDVPLVYHKEDDLLKCHYCDNRFRVLTKCPECGGTQFRNGATGTERVVEELKSMFPDVPIFRMDNDNTRTKNAHASILEQFGSTSPSILVGTQMIAKGHDFPFITLVGIIDADLAIHQADYRATERCYQLVTQVSGRAGRSDFDGEVILQTYLPKHYVYRYASNYDYEGFYKKEIAIRKTTHFPPFASVVRMMYSSGDVNALMNEIKIAYEKVCKLKDACPDDFIFCKAVACPVKRIKSKYRYEIIIRLKKENSDNIISKLYEICNANKTKDVLSFVEINPQSLS